MKPRDSESLPSRPGKGFSAITVLFCFLLPMTAYAQSASSNYRMVGEVLDGGGGASTSANFHLFGCLAPAPEAGGRSASTSFALAVGCASGIFGVTCGNGSIESGEDCDDGNTFNDDGCSEICAVEDGWSCAGEPSICDPICGDGVLEGGEECDDGNLSNDDGCSDTCGVESGWSCAGQPSICDPICGDGTLEGGEECDDGNAQDADGCSASCTVETGYGCVGQPSVCSLIPTPTPTVAMGTTSTPTATPTPTTVCGDGFVQPGECCDLGVANGQPESGCTGICECTGLCTGSGTECTTAAGCPAGQGCCGNSIQEAAEQCDDGDLIPGDGCDAFCQIERFSCCNDASTTCNDDSACGVGGTCCASHCDSDPGMGSCDGLGQECASDSDCGIGGTCCSPLCGNGLLDGAEACDEGSALNGAANCTCSADCQNAGLCTFDGSTCCSADADCASETCCGDGVVSGAEQCDDGNRVDDDGCSNTCQANDGIASCSGFGSAQAIPATVKFTKLFDKAGGVADGTIEKWKSKGSFILSASQAARFDPERQVVQVRFAQNDALGEREELWEDNPVIPPKECQPEELFCFERRGSSPRYRWKYKDSAEAINPGLRKGTFNQRDNEFKFRLDGKRLAEIAVPSDMIGADLFKVRQEIIVDGLCLTVQVECQKRSGGKLYRCTPTLAP